METKTLSPREIEIAQLLALGYSDKEIAVKKHISEHTVRTHHRNIYEKTNSKNLADITRWWFQTNFEISLGLSPRVKLVFWVVAMFLSVATTFINLDFVRTRAMRTVKVARVNRPSGRKTIKLELV